MLYPENGQVRSFSQLRRELSKNDLFYLEAKSTGSTTRSRAAIDHEKPTNLDSSHLHNLDNNLNNGSANNPASHQFNSYG